MCRHPTPFLSVHGPSCVLDSSTAGLVELDDFEDNMLKPQQLLNLALLVAILGERAIAVVQHQIDKKEARLHILCSHENA